MCYIKEGWMKVNISDYVKDDTERYLNPSDINLPQGYQIEVFAQGFDAPCSMLFTDRGELLIAESGLISKNARIIRLKGDDFELIAEGFRPPITGINYRNGNIYVSHKGNITIVKPNGDKLNIITGLPSNGDYGNSNVAFGHDGKMYFGQGTSTNSGVVGIDNDWISERPLMHDNPGSYIMLNGQNFETKNIMIIDDEKSYTGAYSAFGVPNTRFEVRKGVTKASGSILKSNIDGTGMEMVSWGFRFPCCIKFDHSYRLFVANQGFEDRGSRPIVNAADEFHLVSPGVWYGWPDFTGGEPVTSSRFQPEGGKQPEFLLTNHPNVPPRPYASFPSHSNIMGFDFNYNRNFGTYGDVYIAEFGSAGHRVDGEVTPYAGFGHRVSKIEMNSGGVSTFAINKSGFPSYITREGGFGRPVDVCFGPEGAMYVLDMGINATDNPNLYYPKTGVIWRITKSI
ncbi:MAG: PQQ-dependent sugar dehydrogenase [Mobilitalea sp.]